MRWNALLANEIRRAFGDIEFFFDGIEPFPKDVRAVCRTKDDRFNAWAFPEANLIIVGKGILKMCRKPDELLFVIGHELGHCRLKTKTLKRLRSGSLEYMRRKKYNEELCDKYGADLVRSSGYDLKPCIDFLTRLYNSCPSDYTLWDRIRWLRTYAEEGHYGPDKSESYTTAKTWRKI